MAGYAPKDVTTNDQSNSECPFLNEVSPLNEKHLLIKSTVLNSIGEYYPLISSRCVLVDPPFRASQERQTFGKERIGELSLSLYK